MAEGYLNLSSRTKRQYSRYHDVGGQYTRHGQGGMAYGSSGYLDTQRQAGYPPFGRRPQADDGSGRLNDRRHPGGSGYGRSSRGAVGDASKKMLRAAGRLGFGLGAKALSGGFSAAFDFFNPLPVDPTFGSFKFDDPDGRMEPQFPPGYSCVSYRDSGVHSVTCSTKYHSEHVGPNTNATDCHTWHYVAQAFAWDGQNPASYKPYIRAGPVLEGIYGCRRFNYDWVAKYPQGKGPTTRVEWVPKQETRTLPMPVHNMRPLPPAYWESTRGSPLNTRPPKAGSPVPRYAVPSIDIRVAPAPGVRVVPSEGAHMRKPPYSGVPGVVDREKKGTSSLGPALGALARAYDAVTEMDDVADALAQATRGCENVKGLAAKINCVYDNLDKLDIPAAVRNLAYNQAEDAAVGKFHAALKKAKAPFGSSMYQGYMR